MTNALLGHLPIADECFQRFPRGVHPHLFANYIKEKWALPDLFYVDWRPAGPLWCFIADPELASQYVTTDQSLPKSTLETDYLDRFLGKNNMVSAAGHKWKSLRVMFNPGFSANNLMTLVPYIIDASLVFCEVMQEKASEGEIFELEEYATRLTIDIIGKVTLDADLNAQKKMHPIVTTFRDRTLLMPPSDAVFFWKGIDLTRPFRLWWNARTLDRLIGEELDRKILRRAAEYSDLEKPTANGHSPQPKQQKKRSVIDLALQAYEKEIAPLEKGSPAQQIILSPSQLPRSLRTDIIDSVKTFIFAGHDTTSSTISYIHYLLHLFPAVHVSLKRELDGVFPPGTSAAEALRADPYLINKLEYTNAVIRETMRLFPPASTLRTFDHLTNPKGVESSITDPKTGDKYPLDLPGMAIWPIAHLIHRNRRFFPEPLKFIPERFIPHLTPFPDAELFTPAGKDAYRPFEKGSRNCIGQELAMIETKVILALTAREFDFAVEFPGDPEGEARWKETESVSMEFDEEYARGVSEGRIRKDRVEGHKVYQILKGSAKPVAGCPGRIRLRV
jgi:cytochrome P450